MVIGTGPAGMEAARVAALRGHKVTLVERSDRLGGTLFFAGLAYPENGKLLDYLVEQVKQLPIEVRLSTEATPELLAQLKPDSVLVASGARRAAPAIQGAGQRHVWSGDELRRLMTGDRADEVAKAKLNLAERAMFKAGGMLRVTDSSEALQSLSKLWMPLGKKVVIVGGGLVGLELAEFLLARGRQVTVLEPGDKAGRELSIVRRWRVLDVVTSHGTLHLKASVSEITAQDVVWHDAEGTEQRTPADSVVLAIGADRNAVRIVPAPGNLRLAPDDLKAADRRAAFIDGEDAAPHRCPARVAVSSFGPAQIDRIAGTAAARREERDIAKAALAAVVDGGGPGHRAQLAGGSVDEPDRAGLLGDHQQAGAGDERGCPGLCKGAVILHGEVLVGRRRNLAARRTFPDGAGAAACEEDDEGR